MRYRPGESGNPGGRPKMTPEQKEFEANCRNLLGRCFEILRGCLNDGNWKKQQWAVELVLDRGIGKAIQFTYSDQFDPREYDHFSDAELEEKLRELKSQYTNNAAEIRQSSA